MFRSGRSSLKASTQMRVIQNGRPMSLMYGSPEQKPTLSKNYYLMRCRSLKGSDPEKQWNTVTPLRVLDKFSAAVLHAWTAIKANREMLDWILRLGRRHSMYSIGATIQPTIVVKEKTVKLSELHRILLNFSSSPVSSPSPSPPQKNHHSSYGAL